MQPSELQVQRSIAALRRSTEDESGPDAARPWVELPPEVLEMVRRLDRVPPVRRDRVDAVRARLAQGSEPSADDIAGKLVGRLVCDRLR